MENKRKIALKKLPPPKKKNLSARIHRYQIRIHSGPLSADLSSQCQPGPGWDSVHFPRSRLLLPRVGCAWALWRVSHVTLSTVTLCPQVPRCEKRRWTYSFRPQPRPVLAPPGHQSAGCQQQTGSLGIHWPTAPLAHGEGNLPSRGSSPLLSAAVVALTSSTAEFRIHKNGFRPFIRKYFKHRGNLWGRTMWSRRK